MKILTFNLWHGLTQNGISLKSVERPQERETRLEGFLRLAREAGPDLIFLQEVNPAPALARRIARELHMDEIHKVCNSGVKLLWGVPLTFRSGQVILARKDLRLERIDALKLPGSGFGWCGDHFSLQLTEHRYTLVGRIHWHGRAITVAGVHLHHTRALNQEALHGLAACVEDGTLSAQERDEIVGAVAKLAGRRRSQVSALVDHLHPNGDGPPVILGGDFNAPPDSTEIRDLLMKGGFIDSYAERGVPPGFTWDPDRNPNVARSFGSFMDVRPSEKAAADILKEMDRVHSRIDYVFLSRAFRRDQIVSSELFGTQALAGGLRCSDHFGVLTTIRNWDHGT